jgi:hypothetical protein
VKQGVLVVLGHKGSGKTQLVRRFLSAVTRSVCIDTLGEYGGVVITDPHSLAAYLEANRAKPLRVSYRDVGDSGIPPELIFRMLHAYRDGWLCLEEASKWGSSNTTLEDVRWFLQYGRHVGISVVLVARRPAELDRMGTAQADTVVSFRQHEPRDLDYVRQLGGPEAEARVAGLGPMQWDYVIDHHDEIRDVLESISEDVGGDSNARMGSGGVGRDHRGGGGSGDRAVAPDGEGDAGPGDGATGSGPAGVVTESGDAVTDSESAGGDGACAVVEGEPAGGGETRRGRRGDRKT